MIPSRFAPAVVPGILISHLRLSEMVDRYLTSFWIFSSAIFHEGEQMRWQSISKLSQLFQKSIPCVDLVLNPESGNRQA